MMTTYDSFPRYLAAKKSVDDRALNQHVWDTLHQQLRTRPVDAQKPLRVLEIGAGIGTMVERALTRGLFTQVDYTLVDAMAENIATARQRVPAWAAAAGFTVQEINEATATAYQINHPASSTQLALTLHTADCFDFAAQPEQAGHYDLLIAHAFLDLVDIPSALPRLQRLLRPQALCYLTINFDGATLLQPEIDPPFDHLIEALYHETMDKRVTNGEPSGDSRSGRHLFGHLRNAGIDILAAGSSDWVVFAGQAGYPADEAYFLHFIIQTMAGALRNHPALEQARFDRWITERHAQIERGELVYIAHQLDFLGQVKG
jgi:SAM-dependent methyltransferase